MPSSFSVAKKNQAEAVRRDHEHLLKTIKKQRINATAAPAAMKGSARARTVIAAPVKAEDRLLKVCASVADKNDWD